MHETAKELQDAGVINSTTMRKFDLLCFEPAKNLSKREVKRIRMSKKQSVQINLSEVEGDRLISRSQAKRLFSKIEPFTYVTLDFAHVAIVGQGFVDEVFRVYPSKHPQIKISYINANDDVTFMINRSLS